LEEKTVRERHRHYTGGILTHSDIPVRVTERPARIENIDNEREMRRSVKYRLRLKHDLRFLNRASDIKRSLRKNFRLRLGDLQYGLRLEGDSRCLN
jgi:hypothetical protein